MSNVNTRQYAASRIHQIGVAAANKIKPDPVHTNEVFALVRQFKLAPTSSKVFYAKFREKAKSRKADVIVDLYAGFYANSPSLPLVQIEGDVAGYQKALNALREKKYQASELVRKSIFAKVEELSDAVVLSASIEPQEGVRRMKNFVSAVLRPSS